jgi:hypothetical protein
MEEFFHDIGNFSPQGILLSLGVTEFNNLMYPTLYLDSKAIVDSVVLNTAKELNKQIQDEFISAMDSIREFKNFPRYKSVLVDALSRPHHVGVYYNHSGVVQAMFINTDILGGWKELQEIQYEAYPLRGTLDGWKKLYNSWYLGESTKYADTVNSRLDMMELMGIAPFWVIIENGNIGMGAYPENHGFKILNNFKDNYTREMHSAYNKCFTSISQMVAKINAGSTILRDNFTTIEYNKTKYRGHTFISKSGKEVFIINTVNTKIGLQGYGFVTSQGSVVRKFFGRIPRF